MSENPPSGERARRDSGPDSGRQRANRRPPGEDSPQPGWRVTPAPDGRGITQPSGEPPKRPSSRWMILLFVVGLLALNLWVSSQALQGNPRVQIPFYPTFISEVQAGNVKDVSTTGDAVQGTFKAAVRYPSGSRQVQPTKAFSTRFRRSPGYAAVLPAQEHQVTLNANPISGGPSFLAELLLGFGPTLLLVPLFVLLMRRAADAGGPGGLMSFGRSRARRVEASEQRVTFADVAGIDEAKDELREIVDFLKNPDKYIRLGGKIPRGVLLSGGPGTGKTLLARAVAGEAGVPFFQMSASEFVEMIVGVGASRVRDLFAQAKAAAPAIIFIDELDAIGRSRASGAANISGGHDEREQTLNQILTEMDGFDPRTGVIVLGATNRPEILDPALLRPGRFDRRVSVQPPDRAGREAILRVHTRSVPLAPEVNLGDIAAATPGMVGADLANLVNEAALLAARRMSTTGHATGPVRRDGADRPGCRAQGDADRGGPAAHGLPRGRARDHRDGHSGRRPGAQGLDHPSWPVAGRDLLRPGRRSVQLRGAVPAGPDQGGAWRARGGGDRVRRHDHRRGIRHPAPDADRPPDGRALGHEPGDRADRGDPDGGCGPVLPGVHETSESTQRLVDEEVRRIVEAAHGRSSSCCADTAATWTRWWPRCSSARRSSEAHAYDAAGLPRTGRAAQEGRPRRLGGNGSVSRRDGSSEPVPHGTRTTRSLTGVVVGAVVDQVPGPVGDVPSVVRRGALPQPVNELKLEALELIGRDRPGPSAGAARRSSPSTSTWRPAVGFAG